MDTEMGAFDSAREFKISALDFVDDQLRLSSSVRSLTGSVCHRSPRQLSRYPDVFKMRRLREKIDDLRYFISDDQVRGVMPLLVLSLRPLLNSLPALFVPPL